jgi:hypothetical protein
LYSGSSIEAFLEEVAVACVMETVGVPVPT